MSSTAESWTLEQTHIDGVTGGSSSAVSPACFACNTPLLFVTTCVIPYPALHTPKQPWAYNSPPMFLPLFTFAIWSVTIHRLPYLGMVGRFRGDDPRVWNLRSNWVPIWRRSDWPRLSADKIGFSLSHLVPEILWPKFCLVFQNVLTVFKHFVSVFSFIFYPFFIYLRSFWPVNLKKL